MAGGLPGCWRSESSTAAWPTTAGRGHSRTVRAVIGSLIRPDPIRSQAIPIVSEPLPRGLEPGVSCRTGEPQEDYQILGPLPLKEHRHHGRRADCRWCCKTRCYLRDRPAQAGHRYRGQGAARAADVGNHEDDVRYRIIADHSRTAAIPDR